MTWKYVCAASDVEVSSLKRVSVDGVPLVVANYGGSFRAFPPACPHMEEPLDQSGVIAKCVLTCTKHLWSWDLSTLAMLGETERPLKLYDVKEENGNILAFIEKEIVYVFEGEGDAVDDDDFFK